MRLTKQNLYEQIYSKIIQNECLFAIASIDLSMRNLIPLFLRLGSSPIKIDRESTS